MATIHVLKPTTAPKGPVAIFRSGSAEIILFPGIRYERWAEPVAESTAPATKPKRKRRAARVKRDRITIVV